MRRWNGSTWSFESVGSGTGVNHLDVHASGNVLYILSESGGGYYAFRRPY